MIPIILLDPDRGSKKTIEKLLGKLLPLAECRCFSSPAKCCEYLKAEDVSLVLMSSEVGSTSLEHQLIISRMRAIRPEIEIILIGKDPLDETAAFRMMDDHISDYIRTPVTHDKLRHTLARIGCPVEHQRH